MLQIDRENWGAHRVGSPTQQELRGRPANASLTRTHTTAGMKLRSTPRTMLRHAVVRYIFTAANNRFRCRYLFQFWAKGECAIQGPCKSAKLVAITEQPSGRSIIASSGETGNLAF